MSNPERRGGEPKKLERLSPHWQQHPKKPHSWILPFSKFKELKEEGGETTFSLGLQTDKFVVTREVVNGERCFVIQPPPKIQVKLNG